MKSNLLCFLLTAAPFAPSLPGAIEQARAKTVAPPIPYDLAFGFATLGPEDRPSLSSDGRWLAYSVRAKSEASAAEPRLPNGVPRAALGDLIYLTDTTTGEQRRVGPTNASCWRPSVSPDARQLAFYSDADGVTNLWLYDVAQQTSRKLSAAPIQARTWAGDEPIWSHDGREIILPLAPPHSAEANVPAPESSAPDVTAYGAGRELASNPTLRPGARDISALFTRENRCTLAAVEVASGNIRAIVPLDATPAPSLGRLSPSGRWLAYLSIPRRPAEEKQFTSRHDLAVAAVNGGKIIPVATNLPVPKRDFYVGSYVWHPTRDEVFWIQDGQLWTLDLATESPRPRRLAPEVGNLALSPLAFTRDGQALIVGTDPLDLHDFDETTAQGLLVVPLTGSAPRPIALPQGVIFPVLLRQKDNVAWQPTENTVTIMASEKASTENQVIRFDLASGAVKVLWHGLAHLQPRLASSDHQSFLADFEDLHTPVNLYRFAPDFQMKAPLTNIEPRLAPIRFGPAETFTTTVPFFDGKLIEVTSSILLPEGAKRGDRLPCVIFLYPGAKVSSHIADYGGGAPSSVPLSAFITRGYAVLLVEAPLSPFGTRSNPAADMVDALLPQVYHAAELGYVDVHRLAVCGQSFGGYSATAVLTGTNLFRAGIAISGLYDLGGAYAWMSPESDSVNEEWAESGQGRMGGPLWSDVTRYLNNSPYYRADRIHAPLLMLHGTADNRCPVDDARRMFNSLKRLGGTVQLAEYKGEGHVVFGWSRKNSTDAVRRMVEFLDKYVKDSVP